MVCNPQKFKGWPLAESVWLQPSRIQFFHHQDDMKQLLHFPRWHPSGADPVDIRCYVCLNHSKWCGETSMDYSGSGDRWYRDYISPYKAIYNYLVYKRYILQIGWLYTTTLYKNLKNPLKTLAINSIQVIQFVTFWFLRRSRLQPFKGSRFHSPGPKKVTNSQNCQDDMLYLLLWALFLLRLRGFRVFPHPSICGVVKLGIIFLENILDMEYKWTCF